MKLKVYEYKKCSSCRKALNYLDAKGIEYEAVPIRETPPTLKELKCMLKEMGSIKKLLNTSGQDYRSLGLKDKIDQMSEDNIFALLRENGNLVKRPFVIGDGVGITGFKESSWDEIFG